VQQVALTNIGLLSAKAHTQTYRQCDDGRRHRQTGLFKVLAASLRHRVRWFGGSLSPHLLLHTLGGYSIRACQICVDMLEKFHPDVPVIKWPPRPEPTPHRLHFRSSRTVAIDEMSINAGRRSART